MYRLLILPHANALNKKHLLMKVTLTLWMYNLLTPSIIANSYGLMEVLCIYARGLLRVKRPQGVPYSEVSLYIIMDRQQWC